MMNIWLEMRTALIFGKQGLSRINKAMLCTASTLTTESVG